MHPYEKILYFYSYHKYHHSDRKYQHIDCKYKHFVRKYKHIITSTHMGTIQILKKYLNETDT